MKINVMIQYVGHVVNAGGNVTYRAVQIDLTDDQCKQLHLERDEDYAVFAIESD